MFKVRSWEITSVIVIAAALAGPAVYAATVEQSQSTAGQYVDDSVLTAKVKAKFVEEKSVDATSISVETQRGVVQLTGFAKTPMEKSNAERLAKSVDGVIAVKNDIIVKS